MTTRRTFASKPRRLEARAFHDGAHGIDPETGFEQIEAQLTRELSEEKEEPTRKMHHLESKLQQAQKERPEAEAIWQRVRTELGDTPPPYFHAVVMAIFSLAAQAIDTLFLAPTMDLLNIANELLQYVGAVGLAAISTGVFEFAFREHESAKNVVEKRRAWFAGTSCSAALVAWGILRGRELQFAAGLSGNPVGDFLGAHPFLTTIFFIFITLATPMLGAAALLHGLKEFTAARTWRRAKRRFDGLRSAEVDFERKVQAERAHISQMEMRNTEECREWRAIYRNYYERGQKHGARREPFWSVVLKAVGGALLIAPLALLLPASLFLAQLALPVIAAPLLFAYFNHLRHHPNYERFLKQQNTRFVEERDAFTAYEVPSGRPRLLSKGDKS